MPKFRKKPIEIEAVQFTGTNWDKMWEFVPRSLFQESDNEDAPILGYVWDKLHSTWVGVKAYQWIIEGVQGEFYPCDESVFASTYEPVDD
jgi:hypothetical protein